MSNNPVPPSLAETQPRLPVPSGYLTEADHLALQEAFRRLENPSFAVRLSSRIGRPIEKFFGSLPDGWQNRLNRAVRGSLEKTLNVSIRSLGQGKPGRNPARYHRYAGMLSGAAGGLFGLPAVLAELPVTTAIILRAVAEIARSEGENLDDPATRLACMEVFALGGRSHEVDAAETGYYGVRLALGLHLSVISPQVAATSIARWNPPMLVRFVAEVASRFGVAVTQKAALQIVPILGAGTGSLVNWVFIDHYQDIARGHFALRRLERVYGRERIQHEYQKLGGKSAALQ